MFYKQLPFVYNSTIFNITWLVGCFLILQLGRVIPIFQRGRLNHQLKHHPQELQSLRSPSVQNASVAGWRMDPWKECTSEVLLLFVSSIWFQCWASITPNFVASHACPSFPISMVSPRSKCRFLSNFLLVGCCHHVDWWHERICFCKSTSKVRFDETIQSL